MSKATASIRELRLDFRAIKRKIEEYGEVLITDNGVPSYVLKAAAPPAAKRRSLPDYAARLAQQESPPLTREEAASLHEENRGDR
jgi:hypothetical protein